MNWEIGVDKYTLLRIRQLVGHCYRTQRAQVAPYGDLDGE